MPVVKHYEVKTIKVYPQTRGNVKASVLEAEPGYHNIIVPFVYDTKPVHFISTSTESISYIEKIKDVFSKSKQHLSLIKLLYSNHFHY